MEIQLLKAREDHYDSIVNLNEEAVRHTSPMDITRLAYLKSISDKLLLATVGAKIAAFLLVMREKSPYQNKNFEWFLSRYSRFMYVDRIVVDPEYADKK